MGKDYLVVQNTSLDATGSQDKRDAITFNEQSPHFHYVDIRKEPIRVHSVTDQPTMRTIGNLIDKELAQEQYAFGAVAKVNSTIIEREVPAND